MYLDLPVWVPYMVPLQGVNSPSLRVILAPRDFKAQSLASKTRVRNWSAPASSEIQKWGIVETPHGNAITQSQPAPWGGQKNCRNCIMTSKIYPKSWCIGSITFIWIMVFECIWLVFGEMMILKFESWMEDHLDSSYPKPAFNLCWERLKEFFLSIM